MRLRRLQISKFGHFEERSVDLGPGFTVVFGPNEAGKSTLLDAVAGFLWGIPQRNPRTRTYAARTALLTGSVEHGGVTVEHRRRLNTLTCDGQEIPAPWGPSGPDAAESWRTSFGLDHRRLREGGSKVVAGGGDLADLISLAETGESISTLIGTLTKRAEELFKDRKNASCEIRTVLAAIEAAEGDLEAKQASAGEVARLRGLIAAHQTRLAGLDARRTDLRRHEGGLEELQRCFRPGADLAAAERDAAALRAAGGFLDPADAEALAAAIADAAAQAETIAELAEATAQAEIRRRGLRLNPAILQADDAIADLQRQVDARREDRSAIDDQDSSERVRAALADLLTRLGRPDASDPADVLIGDAVRQQLGRLARAVVDAAARAERVRERVRALADQASTADEQDLGEGAQAVAHARDRRQSVWSRIRAPWISGDFPPTAERKAIADEFELAVRAADAIVEEQTEAVQRLGEARGTRLERERLLERDRHELAGLEQACSDAEHQWRTLAELHRLPAGIDAAAWEVHDALLGQVADRLQELRDLDRDRAAARARWDAFAAAASALAPLVEGAHSDPLLLTDSLDRARLAAIEARTTDRELADRIAEVNAGLDAARRRLADAEDRIARLTDGLGGEPSEVVERSRRLRAADASLEHATTLLRAAKRPESDLDELRRRIAVADPIELAAQADRVRADLSDVEAEYQELHQELGGHRSTLRQLEARESTAELLSDLHAHGGRLRGLLDEYQGLRVQIAILAEYKQRLEDAGDSPLLAQAGEYLAALTAGRYGGFHVAQDEAGRRIEIGYHDPGRPGAPEHLKVGELSEGTADQVFLALRLAGIGARQAQREAAGLGQVPVVLDDVLITSDDERTRAALVLLGRLGERMQVILMTHHQRVLDAAEGLDGVAVCTLAEVGQTVAPRG